MNSGMMCEFRSSLDARQSAHFMVPNDQVQLQISGTTCCGKLKAPTIKRQLNLSIAATSYNLLALGFIVPSMCITLILAPLIN
jgi:hypothetical protein